MALDPKKCKPGEEQWEEFLSRITARHKEKTLVHYDYRNSAGKLFSCISPTLAHARIRRDRWARKNGM